MSVKVAVRVRPFNAREIELNSTNCVSMVNNTTTLTDPKTNKPRDFTFDYRFFGLMMDLQQLLKDFMLLLMRDMMIKQRFINVLVRKFWPTQCKATIVVYSPMGKQVLEKATQC